LTNLIALFFDLVYTPLFIKTLYLEIVTIKPLFGHHNVAERLLS